MPNKLDLIRQALNASESSIKLARQLLNELDGVGARPQQPKKEHEKLSGTQGVFDGENMVTDKGEKLPVPPNYAAKSRIVVGDTMKLVDLGGDKRFKQIDHVKRLNTTGVLTKKDGKLAVVAETGSYRVLPAAVDHLGAKVGDEVKILVPAGNLRAPWAAIDMPEVNTASHGSKLVVKEKVEATEVEDVKEDKKPEAKPAVTQEAEEPVEVVKAEKEPEPEPEPQAPVVEEVVVSEPVPEVTEKKKEKAVVEEKSANIEAEKDKTDDKVKPSSEESVLLTDEDLR